MRLVLKAKVGLTCRFNELRWYLAWAWVALLTGLLCNMQTGSVYVVNFVCVLYLAHAWSTLKYCSLLSCVFCSFLSHQGFELTVVAVSGL